MMLTLEKPLVLASASPRRHQLMSHFGIPFTCMVSGANEEIDAALPPEKLVMRLAERKAAAVLPLLTEPSIVVGADTIVVSDGVILGKPKNKSNAIEMISRIAGRSHSVYTGLCVLDSETGTSETAVEETMVSVAPMCQDEIEAYVNTGEPMDKAGAYAIQGKFSIYVIGIKGCYYNVMGLPLYRLSTLLRRVNKPN